MPNRGTNSPTAGTAPSSEANSAPPEGPSIIARLRNVSFGYDERRIVEEISLDIPAGKFVSLLGPSGCGKTTLLKLLGGYLFPQEGTIELRSRDVTRKEPSERNIGMVFQNYALFPHLSARRNVAFGLEVRRASRPEITRRVETMLDLVRLDTSARDRLPEQLSGGQQQRVALARALAFGPDLLLLDEPLASLDRHLRLAMRDELKRLHQESQVVTLLVTHDQEEALALSDFIGILHGGRLVQHGTPRELYERPQTPFVARFLGEANVIEGRFLNEPADSLWMIRPEQIPPEGPWRGKAVHQSYLGSDVLVTLQCEAGLVKIRRPAHQASCVGDLVSFDLPKDKLWRIPKRDPEFLAEPIP